MSNEKPRHFNFPPRRDFKNFEETGIQTDLPLGRTIITASFNTSRDLDKKILKVDFSERANAVWLTNERTVESQKYDFIIGPDGKLSSVAIRWINDETPEVFLEIKGKMQKVDEIETNNQAEFINVPRNVAYALAFKNYVNDPKPGRKLTEYYGIMKFPEGADDVFNNYHKYQPYISKETLVSGMRNRKWPSRILTSFWAVSNTDKSDLPFGRELQICNLQNLL